MHTDLAASGPVPDGGGGPAAVRRRLLSDHRDTLAGVVAAADAVAARWDGHPADSAAVTDPLAAELRERDLDESLLSALADAAAVVGDGLPHEPTAAPPYLTVTSRGPVLRATLPAGRLVVVVGVVEVARDPLRYLRRGERPEDVVTVELHRDGERRVAGPGTADDGGPAE